MIGIPMRPPKERRSDERFPCENCPCGCSTADFCWDKCCCHTDEEKLEWARENQVTPPNFLIARVSKPSPPVKSCCCAAKSVASAKSRQSTCDPRGNESSAESESKKLSAGGLILLKSAAECRGMKHTWTLLSQVIVDDQPSDFVGADRILLYRMVLFDITQPSRRDGPDPPIPWA